MGPVEITFLTIIVLFGAVGIVRGYHRELGVTLLLLVVLFVFVFVDSQFPEILKRLLTLVAGTNAMQQLVAKASIYVGCLIVVVFISYQGETLSYPGSNKSLPLSAGAGLLNGYLFAGSMWYYLAQANWPFLRFTDSFTDFYRAALRVLPPAILDWRYLIALIAVMLILRVWR